MSRFPRICFLSRRDFIQTIQHHLSAGTRYCKLHEEIVFSNEFDISKDLLFSIRADPFLRVRIEQVVDGGRVPVLAQAEQVLEQEAVLGHDGEVGEEAGGGLDAARLAVRHADQSGVDQFVRRWVARPPLHYVRLGLLVRQRNGRQLRHDTREIVIWKKYRSDPPKKAGTWKIFKRCFCFKSRKATLVAIFLLKTVFTNLGDQRKWNGTHHQKVQYQKRKTLGVIGSLQSGRLVWRPQKRLPIKVGLG